MWALRYKRVGREHLLWTSHNFFSVWLAWHLSNIFYNLTVIKQTTSYFFIVLEMSNFVPESDDLQKALIFCFHLQKSGAESPRMLVEAYGDHAPSKATCKRWFQRFRDNEWDRLKAMGRIQKFGKWVPHELNERQMVNRKNTCEILLQRQERKSVLPRIVTGDEKWIYFKNPKGRNSRQPSTSTAKTDQFGKKAMLCVWWDQKGVVCHELLKSGETVNTNRYR